MSEWVSPSAVPDHQRQQHLEMALNQALQRIAELDRRLRAQAVTTWTLAVILAIWCCANAALALVIMHRITQAAAGG